MIHSLRGYVDVDRDADLINNGLAEIIIRSKYQTSARLATFGEELTDICSETETTRKAIFILEGMCGED